MRKAIINICIKQKQNKKTPVYKAKTKNQMCINYKKTTTNMCIEQRENNNMCIRQGTKTNLCIEEGITTTNKTKANKQPHGNKTKNTELTR